LNTKYLKIDRYVIKQGVIMDSNKIRLSTDISTDLNQELEDYCDTYEMSKASAVRSILSEKLKT